MTTIDTRPVLDQHPRETSISTELFGSEVEPRFWLGEVASQGQIFLPEEFLGARILRANTYIEKCGFLPPAARQEDGGESDIDDAKSVHFVAIENEGQSRGNVSGNLRLIIKESPDQPLPVERLFPDAFPAPASESSAEASRFISEHPDDLVHGAISVALIRAAVMGSINRSREPVYAVIEEPLERRFRKIGLPFDVLAEPRPVEEYNDTLNLAIRFHPEEILRQAQEDKDGEKIVTAFMNTAEHNAGLGYYDQYLLKPELQ